jgi:hypothetical protein
MLALNLPPYPYKIKQSGGKLFIFDVLRHKYVFLTPEEWVRQHLVHYLTGHHGYPKALMRTETGLKYNTLYRRSDLLVYDPAGNPFLLAECKDVSVPLTAEVLAQAAAYNHVLRAPYVLLTNGLLTCCLAAGPAAEWLGEVPPYPRAS